MEDNYDGVNKNKRKYVLQIKSLPALKEQCHKI